MGSDYGTGDASRCDGIVIVHNDGTLNCTVTECSTGNLAKSHSHSADCFEVFNGHCQRCGVMRR